MDGERLVARSTFVSRCDQAWQPNDIFDTPVDGIVDWQWSIDLAVSP
jgi:hypothetical protein